MADHLSETGSGITRRRTRSRALDDDAALADFAASTAAMFDFEAYTADLRTDAESVVKQIEAKHGVRSWRPHEDLEWYYYEMIRQHDSARDHIARDDANGAACAAMRFENARTEMWFKVRYEGLVSMGLKAAETKAAQRDAGLERRKRSDEERLERWLHYYLPIESKTGARGIADGKVAKEFGEAKSTIRRARKDWRKSAKATI